MRHATSSILNAISNIYILMADGEQGSVAAQERPMVQLDFEQLRLVVGGDETLPKGGWIAAATTAA
jgi:hypothetical protein